jgi:diguanylate cyclase (GGDEF)-like protein
MSRAPSLKTVHSGSNPSVAMRTPPTRRKSDFERHDEAGLRALVVEDDPAYAEYIRVLAKRFGFGVTLARNGTDALRVVETGTHYDLFIIDWEMPGLTGIDLIEILRAREQYADVFAIMLTTHENTAARIRALRAGFDDFVSKSAGEVEIAAKLNAARRLVTRQKRLDATVRELYGLATRDELTGVYNRRFFFSDTERLLAEGRQVDLVFIDLDNFKTVNDTWGHLAGDRVLRDVGDVFAHATRDEDIVARYGGDEFVLLVVDSAPEDVECVTHRIAGEIAALRWTFNGSEVRITVTTGCARSSLLDRPTVAQLITAGDRDLYKNKWLRKHPDADPSLYEYDRHRQAHVADVVDLDQRKPRKT